MNMEQLHDYIVAFVAASIGLLLLGGGGGEDDDDDDDDDNDDDEDSGVTPIGQFRSMNRLPFRLNRLPCPQND